MRTARCPISEALATVRPLASYIAARNWAVAGAADLTNRSTIRWTLHQLVASGVVTVYDAGTEPVWGIGADQHLVADPRSATPPSTSWSIAPSPRRQFGWLPPKTAWTARCCRRRCATRRYACASC